MKTIITALRNQPGNIEAGLAAVFLLSGVVLATGLVATAFATAQSARPSQVTIDRHSAPDAAGLERYYRRGGAIGGYQIVL